MFARLALVFFILLAACGRPEFGSANGGGKVLDSDVDRAAANSDSPSGGPEPVEANNEPGEEPDEPQQPPPLDPASEYDEVDDFAFTAYRDVAADGRNAIVAPHGLARSLVIAHAAAGPELAGLIAAAVGPYLGNDIYTRFNSSDLDLEAREADDSFRMLAGVWVQEDAAVEEELVDVLAMYLGLQLRLIDFASAPEDARNTINNWYTSETDGRISEVLGPRTVDESTRFVVTDATWFAANWGFGAFDPARTTYATFAGEESDVQLPMMATDATLLHFGGDALEAVVLPFDNGFSLVAVLPDDLETFEAALEAGFLDRIIEDAEPRSVALRFPKLEVSDRVSLSSVSDALGLQSAFSPDAEYLGFADGTQLDDAHQRTRVAFDEHGVTGDFGNSNGDPGPEPDPALDLVNVSFDRPFFFAIRDAQTGRYLFLGRVAQP